MRIIFTLSNYFHACPKIMALKLLIEVLLAYYIIGTGELPLIYKRHSRSPFAKKRGRSLYIGNDLCFGNHSHIGERLK